MKLIEAKQKKMIERKKVRIKSTSSVQLRERIDKTLAQKF